MLWQLGIAGNGGPTDDAVIHSVTIAGWELGVAQPDHQTSLQFLNQYSFICYVSLNEPFWVRSL